MCLNERCSRVRVGKHLCVCFQLKRSETRKYFTTIALQYSVKRVHVNLDGLKLNGTCASLWFVLMMLIYREVVDIL